MRLLRRILRLPRSVRLAAGMALVGLGAIGLFLPILQGTLMLLAGAALLSKDVPALARLRRSLTARFRRRSAAPAHLNATRKDVSHGR